MPAFLDGNKIMQKILDDHVTRLTEQLEEVAGGGLITAGLTAAYLGYEAYKAYTGS